MHEHENEEGVFSDLVRCVLYSDARTLPALLSESERLYDLGKLEEAEILSRRAAGIATEFGAEPNTECQIHWILGDVLSEQGQFAQAEEGLHRALRIAEQNGLSPLIVCTIKERLSSLSEALGRYDQAEQFLASAEELADQHDLPELSRQSVRLARARLEQLCTGAGSSQMAARPVELDRFNSENRSVHRRDSDDSGSKSLSSSKGWNDIYVRYRTKPPLEPPNRDELTVIRHIHEIFQSDRKERLTAPDIFHSTDREKLGPSVGAVKKRCELLHRKRYLPRSRPDHAKVAEACAVHGAHVRIALGRARSNLDDVYHPPIGMEELFVRSVTQVIGERTLTATVRDEVVDYARELGLSEVLIRGIETWLLTTDEFCLSAEDIKDDESETITKQTSRSREALGREFSSAS